MYREDVTGVSACNGRSHFQGVGIAQADRAISSLIVALECEFAVLGFYGLRLACEGFNLCLAQCQCGGLAVTTDIAQRDCSIGVQTIKRLEVDGGVHQHIIGTLVAAVFKAAFKHHQIFGVGIWCGCSVCRGRRNGDSHAIVATLDSDGQRRGGCVAIAVSDGVGVGLGQRLAKLQALHFKVAVVEREGVASISIEHQSAMRVGNTRATYIACHIGIAAACFAACGNTRNGRTICALNVFARPRGDDVARRRSRGIFKNAVAVVLGNGRIVNDLDGDQCLSRVAIAIVRLDREDITGVSARNGRCDL